ncbi:MAG: hypothetical protein SNH73_03990 [Rikenellaceae bacterium]
MKGFTPFKRHANEFKYTPRFYDPQKEERDRRRAELRGSRPSDQSEGEYIPGEYIRRQREARAARREGKSGRSKSSMWFLIIGVALVFLLGFNLLPRIAELFLNAGSSVERVEPIDEYKEFDPYAPIRIVPNDYKGD